MADPYKVGQVVELNDGRSATVRFVGTTSFSAGDWIGVEFDEALGKNDGSVQGERYFECDPGHGMFLRPSGVSQVLEQPTPKPIATQAKSNVIKGRPSSMANGLKRPTSIDPTAAKRQSINAASPTPAARSSVAARARSPAKLAPRAGAASSATSRGTTPPVSTSQTAAKPSAAPRKSLLNGAPSTNSTVATGVNRPARQSLARPPDTTSKRAPPPKAPLKQSSVRSPKASTPNGPRKPTGGAARTQAIGESKRASDSPADAEETTSQADSATSGRVSRTSEATSPPDEDMNGHPKPPLRPPPPQKAVTTRTEAQSSTRPAPTAKKIEELEMKISLLERKRGEDRERLTNLERIEAEKDRLENIIQKLQTKYQPQQQEIQDLRKQVKEKEERLVELESTQAEHDTTVEMALLDREMAEETAESLRTELEALQARSEELQLEVDVLREENQELGRDMTVEERTSQGWLHMERENGRLREALLRLREMTQEQEGELKSEIAHLSKELKGLGGVSDEIEELREKLSQSETVIEDLRQQLDAALSAEDMVEELTEKNLGLNEQIDDLKMTVEDLENLKQLNDELELNHVETEKQLQDELDFKDAILGEQMKKSAQQDEKLTDYEYTIAKFRELVVSLQSHLDDMRASQQITETEAEELNNRSKAMSELNTKLQSSAAKAQVKTIDLELQKLEAREAAEHLIIVQMFLPDGFRSERDSVLCYLRFKRVASKCRLLYTSLREKFSNGFTGSIAENMFAVCEGLEKLVWIASMCDRFVRHIYGSSLSEFERFGSALQELEPVERILNSYIELWKKNELRERMMVEELTRSTSVLSHLAELHFKDSLETYGDGLLMKVSMMQTQLESTSLTVGYVKSSCDRQRQPLDSADEENPIPESNDEFDAALQTLDSLLSQSRSARVIAGKALNELQELQARNMTVAEGHETDFERGENSTTDLSTFARCLGLQICNSIEESSTAIPENDESEPAPTRIQLIAQKFYSPLTFNNDPYDPLPTLQSKLRHAHTSLSTLHALITDLSQTTETSRNPDPPWQQRSRALHESASSAQDAEAELLRLQDQLHDRASQVRQRDQALEEQSVRIELLESRTKDASAKAERIKELQAAVDAARAREADLAAAAEKHYRDEQIAAAERDRWKQLADARRASSGSDTEPERDIHAPSRRKKPRKPTASAPSSSAQLESLKLEVLGLQSTVRYLRQTARRTRRPSSAAGAAHLQPLHADLEWLARPLSGETHSARAARRREDAARTELAAEGRGVLDLMLEIASAPRFVDFAALPANKRAWRPLGQQGEVLVAQQGEAWEFWRARRGAWVRKARAALGQTSRRSPMPEEGLVADGDGDGEALAPVGVQELGGKRDPRRSYALPGAFGADD